MRYMAIGQILLWIGFLGAALTTVSRIELTDDPWSTISWRHYAVWMLIGWSGVGVLRIGRASRQSRAGEVGIELESVVAMLGRCSTELDQSLASPIDSLTCENVLEIIDRQLSPIMSEFADNARCIAERLGTGAFSQIMSEFASGERYLNRAWSAAADGYVDEVTRSVRIANDFLRAAAVHANSAIQSGAVGHTG